MNTSSLVQKVWNFCPTLRDDGVGSGEYLEQFTHLLFLKLTHEYAQETGSALQARINEKRGEYDTAKQPRRRAKTGTQR